MKALKIIRRMFVNEESLSKQKSHALVKETIPVEQKQEGKFYKDFLKQIYVCKVPFDVVVVSHQAEDQDGDIQPKVAKNTYQ